MSVDLDLLVLEDLVVLEEALDLALDVLGSWLRSW
jgi:hypothetical protein